MQLGQNHGIAADVPTRLQAKAIVRLRNPLNRLDVIVIEAAREHPLPMLRLPLLRVLDDGIAGEHLRERRLTHHVMVEALENARKLAFQSSQEILQLAANVVVDLKEAKAICDGH